MARTNPEKQKSKANLSDLSKLNEDQLHKFFLHAEKKIFCRTLVSETIDTDWSDMPATMRMIGDVIINNVLLSSGKNVIDVCSKSGLFLSMTNGTTQFNRNRFVSEKSQPWNLAEKIYDEYLETGLPYGYDFVKCLPVSSRKQQNDAGHVFGGLVFY